MLEPLYQLDDAAFQSDRDGVGPIVRAELRENAPNPPLHRVFRDAEPIGNLPVRVTGGDQAQDLDGGSVGCRRVYFRSMGSPGNSKWWQSWTMTDPCATPCWTSSTKLDSRHGFPVHGGIPRFGAPAPRCSCLVRNNRMPGMTGPDPQARINAERLRIPTLFITAQRNEGMRMQGLPSAAVEFLGNPFDEVLLDTMRPALAR